MKISPRGTAFIILHEGTRTRAYLDPTGHLTIGRGFTWKSAAFRHWWRTHKGGVLTIDSVMNMAEIDHAMDYIIEREYGKYVTDFLGRPVRQNIFDAMVSAVYNIGPKALTWKWAQAVKAGDYSTAARRLRNNGTTSNGVTLPGLVRRRKEEALLLEHGIYTGVQGDPAPAPSPIPEKHEKPASGLLSLLAGLFRFLAALFKRKD